ncbi:MAG: FAD-dependent oxidoreductase [Pseudomonadota bacterium]
MTQKIDADLCIIGAGSGGLSVAAGAAQLGRKVVLIEKGEMGGDCLNYGCVPSKALLAAAKTAQTMRDAGKFGVASVEPQVDFNAVMDHVHGVIASIAPHDSQERFEGLGVTVLREAGAFVGPREVKAGDTTVAAKHIIVATGSSPFVPPIPGHDSVPYLTNETLFENRTRPDHLIIIGGGPIGVEMAQAHRRLGSEVTIIEAVNILNNDDPECVAVVRGALEREGIKIHEQAKAEKIAPDGDGVAVSLSTGERVVGSHLLMAVGRKPNVDGLNLEAAGIEYGRKGIKTDAKLRTTNSRVYAIGDVAGGPQFTHMAGDHAGTIIRNVLFKARSNRNDAIIPKVTYCDPELASVGLSEKEAKEKFGDIKVARFEAKENDRAKAERHTDGFVKAFTKKNGEIIGATIVSKNAGDLITPWALALANKRKIRDFTNFVAPYPTFSELSKRTAGAWYTPTLFSDRTRKIVSLLATFD